MPDEQKSVEDIKSGIKKTLSQLPASDWTDNTGVYDYLKILNTSRELFDVLAEGILQALSKDPSVNPEVVNSIVKDRAKNAQVADFRPANPDTSVSDKFGENKVVDTDFIYTLINRYNHVLDLLDNLGANGALVKGIKSVKQNLTLLADKQDSMVDLDPILESVTTAVNDIKKTVGDVQTKADAAQADADKALAAVTPDNISKNITDLISSGKVKVDDTLENTVKRSFILINNGASWDNDNNDLSNVSRTVIDNSAFGVNLVTDAGTILKSYAPEKNYQNFVNIKRSDLIEDPIKIPNSGVNIDPGLNYTKRVQLWSGRVPEMTGRDDSSITKLDYSNTDSTIQGLQFLIVMEKRVMTNGVLAEDYTELPLVSSLSNEPQAGKYVCTVPIPVSIKNESFSKDSDTFEIPLSGIGEGLSVAKTALAPLVKISYTIQTTPKTNKSSISFVVNTTDGYALDSVSGKNNGAIYSPKIVFIRNYAVEKPSFTDSELPNGTVLWEGWQHGQMDSTAKANTVNLEKVNPGFSNVGSGIKIHFFTPYLLNSNPNDSYAKVSPPIYDGSLSAYNKFNGGHKAGSISYNPTYYVPLDRGTVTVRTFLNLSKIDEYGQPAIGDWLIIPKERLMNGYKLDLLDNGFFSGYSPVMESDSSSKFNSFYHYGMTKDQFNDSKGLIDYKDNPPYFTIGNSTMLQRNFSMNIIIQDYTSCILQGGLENGYALTTGDSSSLCDWCIHLYWQRPGDGSSMQRAWIALFAIDRVVTYKV